MMYHGVDLLVDSLIVRISTCGVNNLKRETVVLFQLRSYNAMLRNLAVCILNSLKPFLRY